MFFDTGGLTGSQTLSQPGKGNGTVAIAVRPDGSVAWTIAPFGVAKGSVALLSEDNLFYAPIHGPHNGTGSEPYIGLNVVSPQGQVIRHMPQTFYTPALGNDGTIYDESPLKAIDPSGRVLWMRRKAATVGPLIGRHGTIYVGEGTALAAYTPSGRLRWRLRWRDNTLALAERADGDLLVAGRTRLATVRPDGRRLWSVRIRKSAGRNVDRSLIVDAAGTSYVGTDDGKLRIISRNGRPVTTLSVGPNNQAAAIAPRSILGPDGRLLVNGIDGVLRVYGP
jgi:outer membrane protein assembly factor BamB